MSKPDAGDILDLYARDFRRGMIDLSSSSPVSCPGEEPLAEYPEPGGTPELRAAIARLYPGLSSENIVVTNGASEALAASALAFVAAGDTVSLCQGAYPSFTRLASKFGARTVSDPALAKVALVNNPSVPDGRLADLRELARELDAAGTRLVCDEVYLDLRPGSGTLPASLCSKSAISIGDLSKPLGLGGLRIGWAASPDTEAIDALSQSVQVLSGGPSTVAMEIATSALSQYAERYEARKQAAMANAPQVFAALDAAGWTYTRPSAGWTFSARPPLPATASFERRAAEAGIFLASNRAFGMADGSYRLSLFAPAQHLRRLLTLASEPANERIVVLAKAPELSKTRLAREAGVPAALAVANALVDDTLDTVHEAGRDVLLAFTPAAARHSMQGRAPGADLVLQPDGDLGDRIAAAMSAAIRDGSRAVLIGTDTPHLSRSTLDEAFHCLDAFDIVIGPATDGGFYLLGLAAGVFPARLFEDVQWSTSTVRERVVLNARAIGLRVGRLHELTDIDDLASLRTVLEAERTPGTALRTEAAAALVLEVAR